MDKNVLLRDIQFFIEMVSYKGLFFNIRLNRAILCQNCFSIHSKCNKYIKLALLAYFFYYSRPWLTQIQFM